LREKRRAVRRANEADLRRLKQLLEFEPHPQGVGRGLTLGLVGLEGTETAACV